MRLLFVLAITVSAALASENHDVGRAWFPDGTGLEIFAETTSGTGVGVANGSVGSSYGRAVRYVVDSANNVLFGYIVEAYRDTKPGTVAIRVRPLDSRALELINMPALRTRVAPTGLPTVPAVREFHFVRIGEVVSLDLPNNSSSGEKVYDVLLPIDEPPQHPGTVTTNLFASEQLSLKNIALRVNGQDVSASSCWRIGRAARIDVPGHGSYVISASDLIGSGRQFAPNVIASGESLNWSIDGDNIEITSQTNVLTTALQGTIWVYHDPSSYAQDQAGMVQLQTADTVGWFLAQQ
jgi:hypothetical protein